MKSDLVYRLRERARIRRQITTRKSVQEGKPDRIVDLLEEAADAIENPFSWRRRLVFAVPFLYPFLWLVDKLLHLLGVELGVH